jgi:hypothetical protein
MTSSHHLSVREQGSEQGGADPVLELVVVMARQAYQLVVGVGAGDDPAGGRSLPKLQTKPGE